MYACVSASIHVYVLACMCVFACLCVNACVHECLCVCVLYYSIHHKLPPNVYPFTEKGKTRWMDHALTSEYSQPIKNIYHLISSPCPCYFIHRICSSCQLLHSPHFFTMSKLLHSPHFFTMPKLLHSPHFFTMPKLLHSPHFFTMPTLLHSPHFFTMPTLLHSTSECCLAVVWLECILGKVRTAEKKVSREEHLGQLTEIHDVVSADGTVVNNYVWKEEKNSISKSSILQSRINTIDANKQTTS